MISGFSLDFGTDFSRTPYCSGFIVGPRHVITAAHCLRGQKAAIGVFPNRLGIQVGLSVTNPIVAYGKSIWFPPTWSPTTPDSETTDFAVVEVNQSIPLSSQITVANFAPPGQNLVGTSVIVSGWGWTIESSRTVATTLQHTTLPYVDRATCVASIINGRGTLSNNVRCCGGGTTSWCTNDSGSPVFLNLGNLTDPSFAIVGVAVVTTAPGPFCGQPNYYNGFTDMTNSSFQNFIAAAISGNTTAAGTTPFNRSLQAGASCIMLLFVVVVCFL